MHLWYGIFTWIRNTLVAIGLIVGVWAIRYWESVGRDMNLRPDDLFITSAVLVGIPITFMIFIKAFLTDKANKNVNVGNKFLESGDYEKAIVEFDKAISIQTNINRLFLPEEMKIFVYRAKAYIKLNEDEKALNDLNRITNLSIENDIWKNLKAEAKEIKSTIRINDSNDKTKNDEQISNIDKPSLAEENENESPVTKTVSKNVKIDMDFYDCMHCGTKGVLLMKDGRCPNCKKVIKRDL